MFFLMYPAEPSRVVIEGAAAVAPRSFLALRALKRMREYWSGLSLLRSR
jgi:hypothetical protein